MKNKEECGAVAKTESNALQEDNKIPIKKTSKISPSTSVRNDTKNIPKNFGTAISIYIKKNPARVKKLLSERNVPYTSFLQFNRTIKYELNSLVDLRGVWCTAEDDP